MHPSRPSVPLLLSLLLLAAGRLAGQNTHIVNGPEPQAAINAAAPGDILLVDGSYADSSLTITKPLYIHGRPGAEIRTRFITECHR